MGGWALTALGRHDEALTAHLRAASADATGSGLWAERMRSWDEKTKR